MKLNYCFYCKAYLVCFAIFCINFKISAQQNLVPNPSFEIYKVCPNNPLDPPPPPWYVPTNYGIAYCNACSNSPNLSVPFFGLGNFQYAHTGNAFCALDFVNNYTQNHRNYYQVKLLDSLKKNKFYYVEFFAVSTNTAAARCNNIAALFTNTAVYVDTVHYPYGVLNGNPQIVNYGNPIISDTFNWIKVSAIFKAQGGEQYLTLGNFKDDTLTNYLVLDSSLYDYAGYSIDDVSVIPLDSFCLKADAGRDTTITIGDSVFIGSYTNGIDSLRWLQGNTVIDSTRPGFWVKPTTATSYILHQVVNGCVTSDTVTVTVNTLPLKFITFSASPTPPKEGLINLLWTTANEINVSHFNILRSIDGIEFKVVGKVKANNKTLNNYNYIDNLASLQIPPFGGGGAWFYKIAAIDFDGKMSYSEVRTISPPVGGVGGGYISVFPNPAKDVVNISCVGMKEVNVINELGQVVYKQIATGTNLRNDTIIINTKNFNKGLYVVQVINAKGEIKTEKLLVE